MYPAYLSNKEIQNSIGITNEKWNHSINYVNNGAVHAFFMQLEYFFHKKNLVATVETG
jgi:hypothetical protein